MAKHGQTRRQADNSPSSITARDFSITSVAASLARCNNAARHDKTHRQQSVGLRPSCWHAAAGGSVCCLIYLARSSTCRHLLNLIGQYAAERHSVCCARAAGRQAEQSQPAQCAHGHRGRPAGGALPAVAIEVSCMCALHSLTVIILPLSCRRLWTGWARLVSASQSTAVSRATTW